MGNLFPTFRETEEKSMCPSCIIHFLIQNSQYATEAYFGKAPTPDKHTQIHISKTTTCRSHIIVAI